MKKWWGPEGYTTPSATLYVRVGGRYHYCMRAPDGEDTWATGVYKGVVRPERLVMTDSFADSDGNIVPASAYGIEGGHPLEMLITVRFEEMAGRTRMTLRHSGLPPGGGQGEESG